MASAEMNCVSFARKGTYIYNQVSPSGRMSDSRKDTTEGEINKKH
jgi:hypothetical protein